MTKKEKGNTTTPAYGHPSSTEEGKRKAFYLA